jgi:hypothetical protein
MQERPAVVVGVDGSAYSRAALTYAMEEAARRGTGVQVVSAFLPPQYRPAAYGLTAPPTLDEIRSDLRFLARRMVDEVVAEAPALGSVPVECPVTVIRPKAQPEAVRDSDAAATAHDRHRVQLVDRAVAPLY